MRLFDNHASLKLTHVHSLQYLNCFRSPKDADQFEWWAQSAELMQFLHGSRFKLNRQVAAAPASESPPHASSSVFRVSMRDSASRCVQVNCSIGVVIEKRLPAYCQHL